VGCERGVCSLSRVRAATARTGDRRERTCGT
jgi:hypothetical protein